MQSEGSHGATSLPYSISLSQEKKEIRLISLSPGKWDDAIECDIRIASLNEHPAYEALSYVWAAVPGTSRILLGGHVVEVSTNLFMALRRLRKKREARIMWVDALSINQADLVEKSHQVNFMGVIYTRTAQVLIWLGDYSSVPSTARDIQSVEDVTDLPWNGGDADQKDVMVDSGYAAFQILHELFGGSHLYELSTYRGDSLRAEVLDEASQRALESLWTVLNAPWFRRVWVVQEVMLSPRATVIFGSIHASWDMFVTAAINTRRHCLTCCYTIYSRQPNINRFGLQNLIENILGLVKQAEDNFDRSQQTLRKLLWRYHTREATDPRDMVYALLGILTHLKDDIGLQADYMLSTQDVYERTAIFSMTSERKLSILMGSISNSPSMPSWVPDWSLPADRQNWIMENRRLENCLYNASKDQEITIRCLAGSLLSADALHIDTVSEAFPLLEYPYSPPAVATVVRGWWDLAGLPDKLNETYIGGGTWMNAFWRTMVRDQSIDDTNQGHRLAAGNSHLFEQWWKMAMDDRLDEMIEHVTGRQFQREISIALSGQRLFLTQKGYIGLGVPRVGDQVHVLAGGDVPFVLRLDPESSSSLRYRLVGDCYLHGIMDGEAMGSWEQEKKTIILY